MSIAATTKPFFSIHTLLVLVTCIVVSVLTFAGQYRFTNLGFDAQTILTWEYAAQSGFIPYKDVFYPYGLLQYYYESSLLAQFIMIGLVGSYFFITYKSLYRSSSSWLQATILLCTYYIFVVRFTGFSSFARYGCSTTYVLLVASVFQSKRTNKNWLFAGMGVLAGLCVSLFLDQGIYCFLAFLALLVVHTIHAADFKSFFSTIVLFVAGTVIGAMPLLGYLWYNGAVSDLFRTLSHLPDLTQYAKTPFFSSIEKPENIFLLLVLLFSVTRLTYQFFIDKKKFNYITYAPLGLTVVLGFAMYKNTVRLIDREITFIALLLLQFIIVSFRKELQKILGEKKYVCYLLILFLYISTQPFFTTMHLKERTFKSEDSATQIKRLTNNNNLHQQVISRLQSDAKFNGKVFSYPTDPIFYPLLQQKPPQYLQVYDGSPESAQAESIQYIEQNSVGTVVYNMNVHALQDTVPDYLRANTLLKYLLTHFSPQYTVDTFLIMHRASNAQFFQNKSVPESLRNELLEPYFGMIPLSEGSYKSAVLETKTSHLTGTAESITKKLMENSLIGSKVIFTADCMDDSRATVWFTTNENMESALHFDCRVTQPVALRLARLPIFFFDSTIKKIRYSENITDVVLYQDQSNDSGLW